MNDSNGYAVFFFPNALDTLGEAIKPYLQDGPAGPHVPCREVDTGGSFIEMTLEGRTADGRDMALELMVPGAMVRMIVSARSDGSFGFYDRNRPLVVMMEPAITPVPEQRTIPPAQAIEAAAPEQLGESVAPTPTAVQDAAPAP